MRKLYVGILFLALLVIGGYLYVRFSVLKTKDIQPVAAKQRSVADLRPAIIAKLQELVKNGSNGLYNLSIDKIEPNVLESKLDVFNATLTPDNAALKKLDDLHLAPDDAFKISFHTLHIDGIGIDDLLHKNNIDVTGILITAPVIEMFHKKRSYNKEKREEAENSTLYQRLMKNMKSIRVDKIVIKNGTFINRDLAKNKLTKFNDVSINIDQVLIDSSTQYDKSRFLFAKKTLLSTTDYSLPTPDSLYFLKAGTISISGEHHKLTALNIHLRPRGNKEQFEKKLQFRKERYDLKIPKLIVYDVDWYDLVNWEKLYAKEANLYNADLNVYFDRSLPSSPTSNMQNFPSQVFMKIPLPLYVKKVAVHDFNLAYTEFNPSLSKTGTIYFNNIDATITNLTNMPIQIKQNRFTNVKAQGLFMRKGPATAAIQYDLSKYKTGAFTADIHMEKMDSSILNPIAAPLGEFMMKTGFMSSGTGHVEGDNYNAKIKAEILYNDLRLIPLKKDAAKSSGLKKKTLTSFIANTFLIKNNNPSKDEAPRIAEVSYKRKEHSSFFSFAWKAILTGILKTLGLPLKLADQ